MKRRESDCDDTNILSHIHLAVKDLVALNMNSVVDQEGEANFTKQEEGHRSQQYQRTSVEQLFKFYGEDSRASNSPSSIDKSVESERALTQKSGQQNEDIRSIVVELKRTQQALDEIRSLVAELKRNQEGLDRKGFSEAKNAQELNALLVTERETNANLLKKIRLAEQEDSEKQEALDYLRDMIRGYHCTLKVVYIRNHHEKKLYDDSLSLTKTVHKTHTNKHVRNAMECNILQLYIWVFTKENSERAGVLPKNIASLADGFE